jgi:hypothetical protein
VKSPGPRENFPRRLLAALGAAALALAAALAACAPHSALGKPLEPEFYPQCREPVRALQDEARARWEKVDLRSQHDCGVLTEGRGGAACEPGMADLLGISFFSARALFSSSTAAAVLSSEARGKGQRERFALYGERAAGDREALSRAAGLGRQAAECCERALRGVAAGSGMSSGERRKRLLEAKGAAADAKTLLEWLMESAENNMFILERALELEAERAEDRPTKARIREMERTLGENRAAARKAGDAAARLGEAAREAEAGLAAAGGGAK